MISAAGGMALKSLLAVTSPGTTRLATGLALATVKAVAISFRALNFADQVLLFLAKRIEAPLFGYADNFCHLHKLTLLTDDSATAADSDCP
jgi:hypothetical protein